MDCLTCQGTGEMEVGEHQGRNQMEEQEQQLKNERAAWVYTCPRCGGSGHLEDAH